MGLAVRVPRAATVSCPVCGCRGPATKYCFEAVTVASVSSCVAGRRLPPI